MRMAAHPLARMVILTPAKEGVSFNERLNLDEAFGIVRARQRRKLNGEPCGSPSELELLRIA